MKLKLDENLGRRAVDTLVDAGHEVATVPGQNLQSATDKTLIQACRKEGRCLVSLDLDFANPLLFNPSEFSGIAVIRLPGKPLCEDILYALRTLVSGLDASDITGKLWIIQPGRIREYQQET